MSILNSDPWFGRGTTLFSGPAKYAGMGGSLASSDPLNGTSSLGSQKTFTDSDPRTTNTGIHLSNRAVTCIAVRNTSGAALLPGQVVRFKKTAILTEVDSVAASLADAPLGVVDEYLPASGVANNDIFWLVVSGPTAIKTAASLAPGALVGVGAGGQAVAGATGSAIGVAISATAKGAVRTLVNATAGHSAAPAAAAAPASGEPDADPAPEVNKSKK
jgi:hypothetical protein